MNPFDPEALGALWGAGAQSFLDAQRRLFEQAMGGAPAAARMADADGLAAARKAFGEALAQAEALAGAVSAGLHRAGPPDPTAMRMMERIFDPRSWVGVAGDGDVGLGMPAGIERKLAALAAAWTSLRRHRFDHDALMLHAWTDAAERFAAALGERAKAGEPPGDPEAVMALWVAIADEALLAVQRTDAFLANQRETLKATADLRLAQSEIGTAYADAFGLPTRAEIDDVHRSVTGMRREIRALERRLPRGQGAGAPAEASLRDAAEDVAARQRGPRRSARKPRTPRATPAREPAP